MNLERLAEVDSSEKIARDIAQDWGSEGWWHHLHPIVKATVEWLNERGYLLIVERAARGEDRDV